MSTEQLVELDALTFAQAFRAVSLIKSTDEARPALNAVCCEIYDDGVRLTSTDSYALLTVWVPTTGNRGQDEGPDMFELPSETVVVRDIDGVLGKLCRHAESDAKLLLRASAEPPPITLRTGHAPPKASSGQQVIDGLDGVVCTLEYGRVIKASAPLYEGDYPPYRRLFGLGTPAATDRIQLNAAILGRVCTAAGIIGETLRWDLNGTNSAMLFTVDAVGIDDTADGLAKSKPGARGLIMPIRMRESHPFLAEPTPS